MIIGQGSAAGGGLACGRGERKYQEENPYRRPTGSLPEGDCGWRAGNFYSINKKFTARQTRESDKQHRTNEGRPEANGTEGHRTNTRRETWQPPSAEIQRRFVNLSDAVLSVEIPISVSVDDV